MANSTDGSVSTHDGKTIFLDPKTGHAFIFDKPIISAKLTEPTTDIIATTSEGAAAAIDALEEYLTTFLVPSDLPAISGNTEEEVKDSEGKCYYVFTPNSVIPISVAATEVMGWCCEDGQIKTYTKNAFPNASNQTKHRIMKAQWDWLTTHYFCPVLMAWSDPLCPLFPSIGCIKHEVVIRPTLKLDATIPVDEKLSMEVLSHSISEDHVLAEEREI